MKSKVFVEYSVSQKSFYYDTIERILEKNIRSMVDEMSNDYKVIAIVNNFDEAIEMIRKIKRELIILNEFK